MKTTDFMLTAAQGMEDYGLKKSYFSQKSNSLEGFFGNLSSGNSQGL